MHESSPQDYNKIERSRNLVVIEKEQLKPWNLLTPEERKKRNAEYKIKKEIATRICEKYKKGDVFDFFLEKRHNLYSIILEGSQVGTVGIRDNGDTKQVAIVLLNDALKNKGFGKQLYIKLNEYFNQKDGSVLKTDDMKVSADATNLWAALFKDGLVEKLDERAIDGHLLYRFKKAIS